LRYQMLFRPEGGGLPGKAVGRRVHVFLRLRAEIPFA
jgi:hypothetical protein